MSSEVLLVQLTGRDVTMPGVTSSPSTPQLQTPHLALQTQSSTSSELEMCEKTEAAVPVLGSSTLDSTHPKPPKETPREQQDGHMLQAPISEVTSDLPDF